MAGQKRTSRKSKNKRPLSVNEVWGSHGEVRPRGRNVKPKKEQLLSGEKLHEATLLQCCKEYEQRFGTFPFAYPRHPTKIGRAIGVNLLPWRSVAATTETERTARTLLEQLHTILRKAGPIVAAHEKEYAKPPYEIGAPWGWPAVRVLSEVLSMIDQNKLGPRIMQVLEYEEDILRAEIATHYKGETDRMKAVISLLAGSKSDDFADLISTPGDVIDGERKAINSALRRRSQPKRKNVRGVSI